VSNPAPDVRFDTPSRLSNPARVRAGGFVIAAVFSGAAFVGCGDGGSSDPFQCGRIEPCGGDVFGNWEMVSGCVNGDAAAAEVMSVLGASCQRVIAGSGISLYGTLTFMADLTYATDAYFGGVVFPYISENCRGGRTCAEVQAFLGLEGLMVLECLERGSGCDCSIGLVPTQFRPGGTYLTTGTTLEMRPEGSAAWTREYCVTGSQLHITGTRGSTFLDDMVFEKL
jgi:hypothetical protein